MGFRMSFYPTSISSICGGAWFTRLGDGHFFKYKFKFFTPLIEFIASLILSLRSKLPRFSWNFISWANLDENSISSIFKMISRFCSSHRVDYRFTWKILRIHDYVYLGLIIGPDVIVGTLSPWSEKPIFQCTLFWKKFHKSNIYVSYGHDMGLASSKYFHKLSYSHFKLISSVSQGLKSCSLRLSPILSNLP